MQGWAHAQLASPKSTCPYLWCPITCLLSSSHTLILLAVGRRKPQIKFYLQPTLPQPQEIEMMQLASKQVEPQLHKQGIVQAWFCSCPLTWHLHDDGHWHHTKVYLNRKDFSTLEIIRTSDQ